MRYDEKTDSLYNKDTGEKVCSLRTFYKVYQKQNGESFESIYYDRVSLQNVLRCTECGTVIFSTDHYDGCDPYLKCPICAKYETHFEYWTKEEIEKDKEKQEAIKYYEDFTKYQEESYKRYKKRGNLYDWQLKKWKIKTKKKHVELELQCDNVTKSHFKGLKLQVHIYMEEKHAHVGDHNAFILRKWYTIPLSYSSLRSLIKYRKILKGGNTK